jgi:hypothetical protein
MGKEPFGDLIRNLDQSAFETNLRIQRKRRLLFIFLTRTYQHLRRRMKPERQKQVRVRRLTCAALS